MVDDDLEEGEIEGLFNENLQAQVQVSQPGPHPASHKKKSKKEKRREHANGSGDAYYDVYGREARAGIQIGYGHPIRIPDVQNLIMWTLADGTNPHWAFLKNKPLVSKVVVVAVPGLGSSLFQTKLDILSSFTALPAPVKLIAKSAMVRPFQTVGQLFSMPQSRKRKKYLESLEAGMDLTGNHGPQKEAASAKKRRKRPFPPQHYVASVETLKTSDYSIPEMSATGDIICPEGYAATRPGPKADEEQPKLFGVDCEMCITAEGFELTRVSLVNEQLEVLLDELVLPHNPITDYNTPFSGITPQMLAPVTTCLEDVRSRILDMVPAEALLVGHALHNDLQALKLIHMNVIDTAFLYPHPKGAPYRSSLRRLTEKFLKRQIQNGSHDSIDDARAAMELALLKFRHGPAFGTTASQEESSDPLCEVLAMNGRRCSLVDRNDVLCRHVTGSANAFPCTSDEECMAAAAKEASNPATHFLWTQLRALGSHFEALAWHRRDLTKAELAAKAPITEIHSTAGDAPSAAPSPPGVQKAVARGQKKASVPALPAVRHSAAGQQAAAPATPSKKRKRQELAPEFIDIAVEDAAAISPSKAAKQAALKSHPIQVDEGLSSSPIAEQPQTRPVNNGPSSEVLPHGQQGEGPLESLDQLAASARQHRQHVQSAASLAEVKSHGRSPLGAAGLESKVEATLGACHDSSNGQVLSRSEQPHQALAEGTDGAEAREAGAANGHAKARELAEAPSQGETDQEKGAQKPLTPAQELARQREIAAQDAAQLDVILRGLNERIGRMWQAVPSNGLFIVMAGHGNTADVRRLQEQKWRRQQGLDGLPPWNTAAEEALAQAMYHALQGLCFCAVKQ